MSRSRQLTNDEVDAFGAEIDASRRRSSRNRRARRCRFLSAERAYVNELRDPLRQTAST